MSKKKTKSSSKSKESRKVVPVPAPEPSLIAAATDAPPPAPTCEKKSKMLRAVVVTPAILEAAKAYKKATGVSFYQLGLEAIAERLTREGYLDRAAAPKA